MDAPESDRPNEGLIASRSNALVKRLRAVRDGREKNHIFIEGVRLCEEAISSHRLSITDAFYTPRLLESERGSQIVSQITNRGEVRVAPVTEDVFTTISDTRTGQGIVLVAKRPRTGIELLEDVAASSPLLVVLHGVANPSNTGAILRAAEAAGATGAITTSGSSDPFNPKALRGAMGSSFRLPLWTGAGMEDVVSWCAKQRIMIFSLDARANQTFTEINWRVAAAVIVGAEGSGFASGEPSGTLLRIPMKTPVESLNVAVALAVVLYEAARQREFEF